MKYSELFIKRAVAAAIPLVMEGRELSDKMQAKVVIVRVGYDKKVNEFEEDMKKVLEGFKAEGFDDRLRAYQQMQETDRKQKAFDEWDGEGDEPKKPTDEELKDADDARRTKDEFEKELDVLNKKYAEARVQKCEEECDAKDKPFSEDEFTEIVGVVKTEGAPVHLAHFAVEGKPVEVSRLQFISMVAELLVNV